MRVDEKLKEAIAVFKRLDLAIEAHGFDSEGREFGVAELEAAFEAKDAFFEQLCGSGHQVDVDLAAAVAREEITGKLHPWIQRDHEGNPVALKRPSKLTPEQLATAKELLADPHQSITGVAKLLGVQRNTLYEEIPGLACTRAPRKSASSAGPVMNPGS